MSLLTENIIRNMIRDNAIKDILYLKKDQIITPSAKTYLADKNIRIKYSEETPCSKTIENDTTTEQYNTLFGGTLDDKPEHMTHLRGNLLVFKDHPHIAFRGAMDSLEAQILGVQVSVTNKPKLVEDLEEILTFVRHILRCEVTDVNLGDFKLLGLDAQEIREHSHHTSKYYGVSHFLPNYKHGITVIELNKLRTKTRETELIAYNAFSNQYGNIEREDIIKALNRLSSLFWIMMIKCVAKQY